MPFRRFVCWRMEQVRAVLDTEALQVSDAVFNATHHPLALYRRHVIDALGAPDDRTTPESYSEHQLLEDLVAPGFEWLFVPVIGSAGSGKSHLVRWLATRIPETKSRRVLLIPKTDTNLKDILERILSLCEGEPFDGYRRRLREATAGLTNEQARVRLLNHLAEFVGPQFHSPDESLHRDYRYLVNKLPSYLYDPVIREELLRDGGFLHRLTEHIIGANSQVERLSDRRQITVEDLPSDLANIEATASAEARQFYKVFIGQPSVQANTAEWINKNLNDAITEMLRFRGEDLRQLMRSVRESLAEKDTELFLMIEDFARLQGIDLQLLESLLERPLQPGRPAMCSLRTVLAVNTDYFLKLPDTVRQRVSFHVDLDVPKDLSETSVRHLAVEFASAYLNAVRLRATDLDEWFTLHREDAAPSPSACSECPHRETCHTAFGAHAGYGLYPFNREAVVRLLSGVSHGAGFNPRRLIKDVLKQVLENHTRHLQEGSFPSRALLSDYGGSHLSPRIATELERRDTLHADRRRALLEIYSEGVNEIGLHNLNPGIHEAFDLPILPQAGETPIASEQRALPQVAPSQQFDPLQSFIEPLTAWSNQRAQMPQPLLRKFRPLIYSAVVNHISWDREMLVQDRLASSTGQFQPRCVVFEDQAVEARRSAVLLSLPLPGQSRSEVAMALQALLRFDFHKGWNYPSAHDDFLVYAKDLDKWSDDVVTQLRRPVQGMDSDWDPVPALAEVIVVASQLCRTNTAAESSVAEDINSVLGLPGAVDDSALVQRTHKWADLAVQYRRRAAPLRELLLARIGCVKGGSKNIGAVDASQLIPVIRRSRASILPQERLPENLPSEYAPLIEMRQLIDTQFSSAVAQEMEAWTRWDEKYGSEFRTAQTCRKFVDGLREFGLAAATAGLLPGQLRVPFEEALEQFRQAETDRLLRNLDALAASSSELERFAILSADYIPIIQRAQELIDSARNFVAGVERRADDEVRNLGSDADALRREVDALGNAAEAAHLSVQELSSAVSAGVANAD